MRYFYSSANGGGGININITKYSTASINAIMLIDRFAYFGVLACSITPENKHRFTVEAIIIFWSLSMVLNRVQGRAPLAQKLRILDVE